MAALADRLTGIGLTILGLVLMVSPLALWVAWTDTILVIVLASALVAGVLYCVLARCEKPVRPAPRDAADRIRREPLPEQAMDDLQTLYPFIYHNGPAGGPKFHAVMRRLKRHLGRRPE